MNEQILPVLFWIGLGALLLLCLPVPPVQKLILVVSSWVLRLGLVTLLAAGAYLSLQPAALPAEAARVLADFPGLLSLLPPVGSAALGPALACLVVTPLVPVLAALDFARRSPRAATVEPQSEPEPLPARPRKKRPEPVEAAEPVPRPEPVPEVYPEAQEIEDVPVGVPLMRPIERREAAGAIASAARRPARPAN